MQVSAFFRSSRLRRAAFFGIIRNVLNDSINGAGMRTRLSSGDWSAAVLVAGALWYLAGSYPASAEARSYLSTGEDVTVSDIENGLFLDGPGPMLLVLLNILIRLSDLAAS